MPRLLEILRLFHRKGVVRIGERDPAELMVVLTIMPGITLLVPDVYVEAVIQWLEQRELARLDSDDGNDEPAKSLLGHVAEYRAALGSAETAASQEEIESYEDQDDVPA